MAKQQKSKAKVEEVKKVKKSTSKGPKENQAMAMLCKKIRKAMKQYSYKKDTGGQFVGNGVFMSSEEVQKATKVKRERTEQPQAQTKNKVQKSSKKFNKAKA